MACTCNEGGHCREGWRESHVGGLSACRCDVPHVNVGGMSARGATWCRRWTNIVQCWTWTWLSSKIGQTGSAPASTRPQARQTWDVDANVNECKCNSLCSKTKGCNARRLHSVRLQNNTSKWLEHETLEELNTSAHVSDSIVQFASRLEVISHKITVGPGIHMTLEDLVADELLLASDDGPSNFNLLKRLWASVVWITATWPLRTWKDERKQHWPQENTRTSRKLYPVPQVFAPLSLSSPGHNNMFTSSHRKSCGLFTRTSIMPVWESKLRKTGTPDVENCCNRSAVKLMQNCSMHTCPSWCRVKPQYPHDPWKLRAHELLLA